MDEKIILTTTHPRAQCLDLRATFGRRFRYVWDESYAAERSDFRRVEAAWLTVIPCRFGRIFSWGGRQLAAYCTAGASTRRRLAGLSGTTVVQGAILGCPEIVVTFDVEMIERVAAVMQAKRPRRLSDEQRAVCVARLAALRAARQTIENPHVEAAGEARGTTIGGPVGGV
jgi:hypothetical protein